MNITKTLSVTYRNAWRTWLRNNHKTESEIWLIFFKKDSGKPRISYNDSVEEALCFGWIDSTVKSIDHERFAQRFSPRRPKSNLSPINLERVHHLMAQKKMTKAGLEALGDAFEAKKAYILPEDIKKVLQANKTAWKHFQLFSQSYKRIRIGWIDGARKRPEEFQKRLKYFVKMTALNKQFGFGGSDKYF